MCKVVKIAEKEIGYCETPANSNKTKYGKWFGLDGYAWCGMFVSWCYNKASIVLPSIGFTKGFASCQLAYTYFLKNKMLTTTPVAGDIVLFDWNDDNRYDHTGIFVEWVDNDHFITIEGNTSLKNQSNGGTVMKRKRNKDVAVFVHINK